MGPRCFAMVSLMAQSCPGTPATLIAAWHRATPSRRGARAPTPHGLRTVVIFACAVAPSWDALAELKLASMRPAGPTPRDTAHSHAPGLFLLSRPVSAARRARPITWLALRPRPRCSTPTSRGKQPAAAAAACARRPRESSLEPGRVAIADARYTRRAGVSGRRERTTRQQRPPQGKDRRGSDVIGRWGRQGHFFNGNTGPRSCRMACLLPRSIKSMLHYGTASQAL